MLQILETRNRIRRRARSWKEVDSDRTIPPHSQVKDPLIKHSSLSAISIVIHLSIPLTGLTVKQHSRSPCLSSLFAALLFTRASVSSHTVVITSLQHILQGYSPNPLPHSLVPPMTLAAPLAPSCYSARCSILRANIVYRLSVPPTQSPPYSMAIHHSVQCESLPELAEEPS